MNTWLRGQSRRILAIVAVGLFYVWGRQPGVDAQTRAELAKQFKFARTDIGPTAGQKVWSPSTIPVHPEAEHIRSWMGSVGAAMAMGDLDGDGLPNDLCYADPRTMTITVMPAPGTGARYQPKVLNPKLRASDNRLLWPTGCVPADFNEDGQMDLLATYFNRTPVIYFRAGEDYTPTELVQQDTCWATETAVVTDLDGDGHQDLVIGNYFRDDVCISDPNEKRRFEFNSSLSNAGNGGTNRIYRWTGATAGATPSVQFKEEPNVLSQRVAAGWTLAVAAADLDNDQLPEIYFANDFGPDYLLHNRSKPGKIELFQISEERRFEVPKSKTLSHDSFKGMGADFGDIDGDGRLDLYVTGITVPLSLIESNFALIGRKDAAERLAAGKSPFEERSTALGLDITGWSWDTKTADFNNDGRTEVVVVSGFIKGKGNQWPELQEAAMANDLLLSHLWSWPHFNPDDSAAGEDPMSFFTQGASGRFVNIAQELGMAHAWVGRGVATADVDGDGDLDFSAANQWEPAVYFENQCQSCGSFLGLQLRYALAPNAETRIEAGRPSHRNPSQAAIGAQARLTLPGGRQYVGLVDGGSGHSGRRSQDIHFGLGAVDPNQPLQVDVAYRGPDGKPRHEKLSVKPGWNTVYLGWGTGGQQ